MSRLAIDITERDRPLPVVPPAAREVAGLLGSIWLWSIVSVLVAGALAWDGRFAMNPDGQSYMDMAANALAHGPGSLINGYWSPLYPVLLMAVYAFHPSPQNEIPAVHLLNWIIFAAVTLCFVFFLRRWLDSNRDTVPVRQYRNFVPFAFTVFLLGCAQFITVSVVSPDLCVAGFLFLAAGLYCRIANGAFRGTTVAWVGAVLGLAYYAKTPMFLLGGLLVVVLAFTFERRRRWLHTTVLAAVFFAVTAPLVALQTRLAGRLSIGESGPLAYVWCVLGGHPSDVLSDPAASARMKRPEILAHRPLTLRFSNATGGSYPPWYDPSYWFAPDRARLRLDVRGQMERIRKGLVVYGGGVYYMSALCGGFLFLLLSRAKRRTPGRWRLANFVLLAWCCAAFAMYCLVYVDYRYIGGFAVVFWIAAYGMLLRARPGALRAPVLGAVTCSTLIAMTALAVRDRPSREPLDQIVVAKSLRSSGILPGDAVASAGYSFNAYFSHLAGVRIEAQIVDATAFWSLNPPELQKLRQTLAAAGIKAIVARDASRDAGTSDCRPIAGTRYHRFCVIHL